MRLRPELIFMLWVTAGIAVAGVIFHGAGDVSPLASQEKTQGIDLAVVSGSPSVSSKGNKAVSILSDLPEVNQETRLLFDPIAPPAAPAAVITQPAAAPILPALKGIIESDGELRAIFAPDPSSADYTIVGPGDQIGAYTVDKIGADRVDAHSNDGKQQGFALRGAGESP